MKLTSFVLVAAAAIAGLPAGAASAAELPAVTGAGITYTVPVSAGSGVNGQCTIVADRWTLDYGPSHVYGQAVSPLGIWTTLTCTVTKNDTEYVREGGQGDVYVVVDEAAGTIPVEGIQVCAEIESQFSIDVRPSARHCANF